MRVFCFGIYNVYAVYGPLQPVSYRHMCARLAFCGHCFAVAGYAMEPLSRPEHNPSAVRRTLSERRIVNYPCLFTGQYSRYSERSLSNIQCDSLQRILWPLAGDRLYQSRERERVKTKSVCSRPVGRPGYRICMQKVFLRNATIVHNRSQPYEVVLGTTTGLCVTMCKFTKHNASDIA